ncbi:helix-turn-helix transcriptional regulator [Chloroflexota bacterium]
MPDIVLISRAIDQFEGNLKARCQVADMARSASYSLYHFCRMFNKSTHHTPYDYMMRRRLSEAARELVGTDRKILDIALDFQFKSHETFARAFKRMFGQQPRHFRAQGNIGRWQVMPRLTLNHLQQIARGPYLRPRLVESESFAITGVMAIVREEPADPQDQ